MELTGIRYLGDLDVANRTVFVRVDFNVPLTDGEVGDDARIRGALATIEALREAGARLVLASHLGRPRGKRVEELSMVPVGARLAELIDHDVVVPDDCVGDGVEKVVSDLGAGDVALLENLRFHEAERAADALFAGQLAALADVYVNDAFGTCHRAHASTYTMVQHFPHSRRAAGNLVQRELQFFGELLTRPARPFVGILGGAKVSDKIKVIENLLGRLDTLLIGGAMAYTFLAAQGVATGDSLVEADKVDLARTLLESAANRNTEILLPVDHAVAPDFTSSERSVTSGTTIDRGTMALDIGPRTINLFEEKVRGAGTIIWNGPLGLFEREPFHQGTFALANAVADSDAVSVIGGGDSAAAVKAAGRAGDVSHVSTGGGASLEFLEGRDLPGIAALRSGHKFSE